MKRTIVAIAILVFCLVSIGCKDLVKAAKIEIDGNLSLTMTSYGCPQFMGYVKNNGDATAYNCKVTIVCYQDAAKTTIIDSAVGFPANLGDIPPGTRAYFEAVCFELNAIVQIAAYNVEISWLDKE